MLEFHFKKQLTGSEGNFVFDLKAEVGLNERVAIFGPSGSGKTTLLRMLAGLTHPDWGWCKLNHQTWYHSESNLFEVPQKRRAGLLFQDYALFPNMTVKQNLVYALPNSLNSKNIEGIARQLELYPLLNQKPSQLSGGQKQRVALGRVLLSEPQLFLLDEPLAALDWELRGRMRMLIENIRVTLGVPCIWVTHDLLEVVNFAERVIRIHQGKVVAQGIPKEVLADLL